MSRITTFKMSYRATSWMPGPKLELRYFRVRRPASDPTATILLAQTGMRQGLTRPGQILETTSKRDGRHD